MSKAFTVFLTIGTLVFGLFLAVYVVRFEMLRTETNLLMRLVQLENAPIGEYEAEFGKPVYIAQSVEALHPSLADVVEGKLSVGQTVYFFTAGTLPHKFLVVVSNADGSVAWRTWVGV